MSKVFKKLNLKQEQVIAVINAPASFDSELSQLEGVQVLRSLADVDEVPFGLAFAVTQAQLDEVSQQLAAKIPGDNLLWIAYPKKSSKKYRCEFDRDSGWGVLGAAGFEPVRIVAIDEDWSALRFRRVEFIKTLKRDPKRALSKEGKARAVKS